MCAMMQKLRVCSIAMRRQYAGTRWSGQFTARRMTAPRIVALPEVGATTPAWRCLPLATGTVALQYCTDAEVDRQRSNLRTGRTADHGWTRPGQYDSHRGSFCLGPARGITGRRKGLSVARSWFDQRHTSQWIRHW